MKFAILGALSAFLAVLAGAFGTHVLTATLDPKLVDPFKTAAQYQMTHALALLFVGWAVSQFPYRALRVAGWLFALGTLFFSGSLYAMVLAQAPELSALTPVGGILLLAGWLSLAWGLARGPLATMRHATAPGARNWDARRRLGADGASHRGAESTRVAGAKGEGA